MEKQLKITIVGLGVIGGSFAMAFSKLGHIVYAIDYNMQTIDKAKKIGCIVDGDIKNSGFLEQSDLTFIAIYPTQIVDFIKDNLTSFQPNSIITDGAGLKGHFVQEIEKILPKNLNFIFGHPMAGREKKGFDYADDKVFQGANYILTPTEKTDKNSMDIVENLLKQVGFSNIKKLSPDEHDKVIAYTSQLPHAMAVALINADCENSQTGNYIGDSYRDLTRIANMNEELWSQLFVLNKDNLLEKIDDFEKQLDIIKGAIKLGDAQTLKKCFIKSTIRRNNL